MTSTDIQFLVPSLYDGENMVQRSQGSDASDLTRKVHHVFDIMREDPAMLKARDVAKVVYDTNSQLGKKDERMAHFQRVARINSQLVTALLKKNVYLNLPSPEIAYSMGLVHDLSNAFARYDGKFNQEEKELSLYHLAVELEVLIVADAAQHNAYLEIADMIAKKEGFATVEKFSEWSKAYADPNNPHNIVAMIGKYGLPGNLYMQRKEDIFQGLKLGLIPLAVADCLDDGKSHTVELSNLKEIFDLRMEGVIARHYHDKIKAGRPPTAFGVALVEKGGLQRMELYLKIVNNLLSSSL